MMPMQTPLLSHSPKSTSTFFILAPSAQHLHRNILPANDILHMHAAAVVEIDLVARHEVQQLLQCDGTLHPGQCRAQATVDAVAETEVLGLCAVAVDVEL